jgi:multiple sugar transport system substrate-binding protein
MKKAVLFLCLLVVFSVTVFAGGEKEAPAAKTLEPATLQIVGHRVHKKIATEGPGGDLMTPWIAEYDGVKEVNWNTLEIGPIHDRLFREASLKSTDVAVAYLLNTHALPRVANLLEPLDDYIKNKPIEGFEENFGKGMLGALNFGGKQYGIPMRAATAALMWNEKIFNERGLTRAPETPEELYEYAKKCTFKRADGTQVYGIVQQSHYYYTGVANLARMWDGDFITTDLKVVCNEPGMVNAVELLRKFYAEGLIPQNVPSIQHAEKQRMIEQCVIAMSFDVAGKAYSYNKNALCPDLKIAPHPMSPEVRAKYGDSPPAVTEFWSFVIPKNSKYKEQGWEFIRLLSSAKGALGMAMNGNGPTRASVFQDAGYAKDIPYADVAMRSSKNARVPLPAFDKSPQAMELIDNYIQKVMFGEMQAQAAMDELAQKLKELSTMLK